MSLTVTSEAASGALRGRNSASMADSVRRKARAGPLGLQQRTSRACGRFSWILVSVLGFALVCLTGAEARAFTKEAPRSITDYGASVWKQGEGLPNNSLRALLQTRNGYLWVGTKGGLARFNGTEFLTYSARKPGQLAESEVRALAEGDDGRLYIGTMGGGLSILEDGKFTTLRKEDGLTHDVVRTLHRAGDGSIWIGTDGGLNRFRNGKLETYQDEAGQLASGVHALREDGEGRIWIGSQKGLFRLEGESVIERNRQGPMRDARILAMAMAEEDQLWVATSDGSLYRGHDDKFVLIAPELTPESGIWTLHVDTFGHLWMGTYDGVYRLADDRLEQYPRVVGSRNTSRYVGAIPISDIWAITSDIEGNIWLGSSESGLIRLRSGRFQAITDNDGLPSPWTHSMVESADGELYVATLGGLSVVRGDEVKAISLGTEPGPCRVWALARGDDEKIWAESDCGLFSGTGDQFEKYPLPSRGNERLYAIARTRDGNLWLGYHSMGLLRVTPEGETRWFTSKDGLLSSQVRTVVEARDGALLVGTLGGGFSRIEGDQVTTPKPSGLEAMTSIYDIVEASDGNQWFATRRGLVRRKDGKDVLIPAGRGMPAVEYFYKILEDSLGYLWLTTNVGIYRISLADLNALADGEDKEAAVAWFTDEDGMPSPACSQTTPGSAIGCRGEKLCFATAGGVAVVEPNRVLPSQYAPPVHIEKVLFDRALVDMNASAILGPGRNDIEFDYTALEYGFPDRLHFRYRLDGWDQGWSEPVERRMATYTNLSPGDYQFEVVASNSDGVWGGEAASFKFRVAPRFYQTNSFAVFSALSLMGLVLLVIRLRTRSLKLRTIELEETVQKRTAALAQRNAEMRVVLDNVDQGLVVASPDGTMSQERSKAFTGFFGDLEGSVADCVFEDATLREHFKLGYEQLTEGFLPMDLSIDQLPKWTTRGPSTLRLRYQPLMVNDECTGVLVMANDITKELAVAQKDREHHEQLRVFERWMRDRNGFVEFYNEARKLVERIQRDEFESTEEKMRVIHTLKGNASLVDVLSVSESAHALEEAIEKGGPEAIVKHQENVVEAWDNFAEQVSLLVGGHLSERYELSRSELEKIISNVERGAPSKDIVHQLVAIAYEPVSLRFARIAGQLEKLAVRLQKAPVECSFQGEQMRLPPERFTGFWAAVPHVVRNIADHGLETSAEREARGKPPSNQVSLAATANTERIEFAFSDDGRGIDWEEVAAKAKRFGMPHEKRSDLIGAILSPGFTTSEQATALSGRGVGLSAVVVEVSALGGQVFVESERGQGTTLRFTFPRSKTTETRPSVIPISAAPASAPGSHESCLPR